MKKKFEITHTILFAKGWYKHEHHDYNELWKDMLPFLNEDGYIIETLKEVVDFLSYQIESHREVISDCRWRNNPMSTLVQETANYQRLYHLDNVWVAMFAVLYSVLLFLDSNAFLNEKPNYDKFQMPKYLAERMKDEPNFIEDMFENLN